MLRARVAVGILALCVKGFGQSASSELFALWRHGAAFEVPRPGGSLQMRWGTISLHGTGRLEHGNELSLLLKSEDSGAVVAASDALAGDEDVGHAGPSGPFGQLGAQGLALVAHLVELERLVRDAHVDENLLGL